MMSATKGVHVRGVEELLADVRDMRSREQLADAVRSYQAGANRSAVISTWVAVAFDLTAKIRELAETGEAAAIVYVDRLDTAIASNDVRRLQALEAELLDTCRDEFELISPREHVELRRLQEDRHVCAHPAYVEPDALFKPTPEYCRAHMAAAVESVLRHSPTPGRRALDRFQQEIEGAAWPPDLAALTAHMRVQYLNRGKQVLRRNLAVVIVKNCLEKPSDPLLAQRFADAGHAVAEVAPELLTGALADVVARREETSGLTDGQLLNLIATLGDIRATWNSLPDTSIPRIAGLVESVDLQQLINSGAASALVDEDEVADALSRRRSAMTATELQSCVERHPSAGLVPAAIRVLMASAGWRSAETNMLTLVLPLAGYLTLTDLEGIERALRDNEQVRESSGMPPLVERLYQSTKQLPGAAAWWGSLAEWLATQGRDGDTNDWYAYPALQRSVMADRARHGARVNET